LGTHGHCLGLGKPRTPGARALGLTILTALGLILEILIVEEVLFSRSEDEIGSAIHAL
jgi:hypothetical protein